MFRIACLSTALLPAPLPAFAAGFDCAKAATRLEHAICDNAQTSAADLAMADAWAALRSETTGELQAALIADQRRFLSLREAAFLEAPASEQQDRLRGMTLDRADFLRRIARQTTSGYEGHWQNAFGILEITGTSARLNASDPVAGRWMCLVEGEIDAKGQIATEGGPLQLTPGPAGLAVKDAAGTDYCGLNGGLGGQYFRLSPR